MTQFSLFGAAVAEPCLDDLDGVLLAGGHWVRNGAAARLSVVVADRWRADALAAAFAERGVGGTSGTSGTSGTDGTDGSDGSDSIVDAEEGVAVRTGFVADLLPAAQRWTRGANEGPPAGFLLTPGGLRLWAIAAGRADDSGYLLATAEADDPVHTAAGAQLARLGLAAVSIGVRGGPGWRVTSAKRLRRLMELLGEAPVGAGTDWPLAG